MSNVPASCNVKEIVDGKVIGWSAAGLVSSWSVVFSSSILREVGSCAVAVMGLVSVSGLTWLA